MKIGLVCPYDLFSPGGVKEHVLALYREFKKCGHQVKIIAPKTKSAKNPDFVLLGGSLKFPSPTGSWGAVSLVFKEQEIKAILAREKFNLLHFHEPLVPFLSWQILSLSKTINIATFHSAWERASLTDNFQFLIKPFVNIKIFQEKLHGLIAVSSFSKRCWQPFFPQKITVVPNGIDLTRFSAKLTPFKKYQDGKVNVLFVGRLEKRKGAIYLLRAWRDLDHKNMRLILVGDGPRRLELEIFLKTFQLKNVKMVGRVSDQDLPLYYASADICCFPSLGGESFGIVLLEAMAAGKPIVCFANPGYKEVLKDYPFRAGLVKTGKIKGLRKALEVLAKDASLRKRLSRWEQKEVQKYSWSKVAQKVLEYYCTIRK